MIFNQWQILYKENWQCTTSPFHSFATWTFSWLNLSYKLLFFTFCLFVFQPCIEFCISSDACSTTNASAADQSATGYRRFCVRTQSAPRAPSSCLCHPETRSWHPPLQPGTYRTFHCLKWLTGQFSILYELFSI